MEPLLERVEALETVLANSPGDSASVVAVLNGLRDALQECTCVQSLQESLHTCNVYVENDDGDGKDADAGSDTALNFEERKTVVLAHYNQLSSMVTSAEGILSDYSDVLDRFRSAVSTTPQLNLQVVLQQYKRIELRFIANVQRMLVLLEKYAILRHQQSKLVSQ